MSINLHTGTVSTTLQTGTASMQTGTTSMQTGTASMQTGMDFILLHTKILMYIDINVYRYIDI